MWEHKILRPRIAKQFRKEELEGLSYTTSTYYKPTVMKTVWHWPKDKYRD